MPSDPFDDFVNRQQGEAEDLKNFWGRERDEYIGIVNELYERIDGFLSEYKKQGRISISYYDMELNEEDTGVYTVRKCVIGIGRKSVVFTPVGTQLIGTKGRVDVSGNAGRGRLMLVNSASPPFQVRVSIFIDGKSDRIDSRQSDLPIHWIWKIATNPPNVQFIELNKDSFLNLLIEVSGG